jgi:organic hydroperoxide reductase OsmC/OhrA
MEWKRKLRAVTWSTSGRNGLAKSDSTPQVIHFTVPTKPGGLEGCWGPEDLLLGALASSFVNTFSKLAEECGLGYADLEVTAEATLREANDGNAPRLGALFLRPKLIVTDSQDRERALNLLHKARILSPVSQALSVTPKFDALIDVTQFSLVGCP